ncbi:MAG: T9SS type A sorting domain-containing protein [Bacteroidetes bacterium]|nr:T9SS type A sorting domain-containing protein [Bacteroidota bacterium]
MHKIVVLILFLGSANLFAQNEDLICKEKARLQHLLGFRASSTVFYGYDVHYHRCLWLVNPAKGGFLRGMIYTGLQIHSKTDSIGFDLQMKMVVDSVKHAGTKILFTRNNQAVYAFKPGGWNAGNDSIEIYYHGIPEFGNGFGYYVYDNHQTGPIVYTLSEPYGAAYWWPCKQTLTDKIDSLDIYISTKPGFKSASNGLLISADSLNDSTIIYHWQHKYPVATYLVAMATSNYSEFSNYAKFFNRPDSVQVLNYVFSQSLATAKTEVPKLLPVLRLFDSLFGNYPFEKEKYGHAQFTWGGGMEHQTMSFVVSYDFDLLAHELAHQWFGDKVTCGTWSDLWLNEGFATYCNALCYRYLKPWDWTNRMAGIRNAATSQDDGSIYVTDTATVNRLFSGNLTYNKGAFVLHMLRIKVGDDAFFKAIRTYLQQANTAYGFAKTLDLIQVMEQQSGKKLDTFFNKWYYGEGFPYLKMNWEQSGNTVKFHIQQTPSNSTVPVFDLRIPIRFKNKNTDSIIYFYNTKNDETFYFNIPFAIDTAEFDPEVTVLAKASLGGLNLDKLNKGNFTIAPNPARDEISILTFYNLVQKVEIFDLAGRKVFQTPGNFSHALGENIELFTGDLSNGTYVTRVYTNKSVTSLKFQKI